MLSGTLTPSSASLNHQRPKILYEDDTEIRQFSIHSKAATTTTTLVATSTTTTTTTISSSTVPTITETTCTTTTTTTTALITPQQAQASLTVGGTTSTALATAATVVNERTRTDASGRSAALERAYVHDVYENCEEPVGPIRPRVAQFLAGLDAGSLVCDVGCGNGRYLNACNPFIYSIGVDRCYRLAKLARSKGGEVAICDNLELPFRDESFDAVLSLAVVHHFATTERRVGAIRELARILRIGGRVIISVWALEQRHKRFESQDVLVPWQPPKTRNINTSDDDDDDDFLPPYHAYTEDSTNSSRSAGDGDSSSLSSSSPGESCYSFVRRAIQKLAGGKRHPWFLESWNSKDTKHGSSLDYEDAKDLPIELRRLEDFDDFPEPPLSAGLKSRSLGSILNPPPRTIVRSRSSVPSLGAQIPETKSLERERDAASGATNANNSMGSGGGTSAGSGSGGGSSRRPKLVKQKQSVCEDVDFPIPDFPRAMSNESTRLLLRKQSSLNEELMAESRLREKERVRKRIQKQMSLNEAFLCRSLFTKRLQVIREGFTTKLKSSTGSLERVTKNGLVKIMQNIKGGQTAGGTGQPQPNEPHVKIPVRNNSMSSETSNGTGGCFPERTLSQTNGDDQKPRRHSRESGSDSSKDSSLQSDTSIESEDSFASVIYIPRPDQQQQPIMETATTSTFKMPSVPTSPLVMPCPTPAHSPAPPRCKLQANMVEGTRFTFEEAQIQKSDDKSASVTAAPVVAPTPTPIPTPLQQLPYHPPKSSRKGSKITRQQIKDLPPIPKFKKAPSFPIVRRISAAPAVPKLHSLEIFNPETDDLDSDSSEPSSPDSIDSVISALKPTPIQPSSEDGSSNQDSAIAVDEEATKCASSSSSSSESCSDKNLISNDKDLNSDSNINCSETNDIDNISSATKDPVPVAADDDICRQHLVDFAEKLSAQLLKELDESSEKLIQLDDDDDDDDDDNVDVAIDWNSSSGIKKGHNDPYIKKLNGEIRDLNNLREELRERRLMLANLNTSHLHSHHHTHHHNTAINNNNNNQLKSQQSDTIHEEDESNYYMQDDPEDSMDYINPKYYQCPNSDDDDDDDDDLDDHQTLNRSHQDTDTTALLSHGASDSCTLFDSMDALPSENNNLSSTSQPHFHRQPSRNNNNNNMQTTSSRSNQSSATAAAAAPPTANYNKLTAGQQQNASNESHQSVDSWEHSNSTGSLDSPSVGGSATHHRYYHVFREGELDALINHHVASLHIVSSYYERASWCVVAEKVQVWTI